MRILTWNIQWGRGIDGLVDLKRIAAYLRDKNADVICLQEVSASMPDLAGCDGEDQFASLSALFPDFACVNGDGLRFGPRRFGNMILSRYEVLQEFLHPLPWPADGLRSIPRCALEAVVASPMGPMRIITTHLEYFSYWARVVQVQAIAQVIRDAHARASHHFERGDGPYVKLPQTVRTVLLGDFNTRATGDVFLPFGGLLTDAWCHLNPHEDHPPSFCIADQTYGEEHCCDFIFVSEPLRPTLCNIHYDTQTRLSDHQPVWIDVAEGL